MLQNLRDNSKGVVSGILVGLLVIIFALTGAETLFNNDPNARSVIKVNGDKISESDIARATSSQKQQIMERYGESVPTEFLTDDYLRNPVIDNLIQRQLLVQTAARSGMTVGSAVVDQQILNMPQFQTTPGQFDVNRYQLLLRNIAYTPSTYKKALVDDVIINQLTSGIVDTSFVTPTEIDRIISLSFQTRDFDYIILPAAQLNAEVIIEDAAIKTYYDANAPEFTVPEEVAVDYIDLNVEDLLASVDVSDEEIRKQFAQNLAAFVAKPETKVAHLLIEGSDAAKIEEVAAKIAAGEDFAELVKVYSDDLGSKEFGGDLGVTTGDTFPESFESALAALDVGEVSGPVVTDAGTHFIKKISERGVEPPTFEEEKENIAKQLKRDQAEHTFVSLLERLRDLAFNAESLADVASELDLPINNSGLISRTSGEGITRDNRFISAAFGEDVLENNNASDVIELSPTRVIVLKKTDYKASHVSDLDEVKDAIVATLTAEKTRELLAQKANSFKAAIAAGKTLTAIAEEASLEVKTAVGVNRNSQDVDRDVLHHAFSMAKPVSEPVIDGVATSSGDYAVVSLKAITSGASVFPEEQRSTIAKQLSGIAGENDFRNTQNLLLSEAKIKR